MPQATHLAHVLLAAQGVNHTPRAEEEQSFEEGVGHQMENAGGERADAARQEHISQLAHGRIGQHPLDVILHQPDRRGPDGRRRSDHRHQAERRRSQNIQRV